MIETPRSNRETPGRKHTARSGPGSESDVSPAEGTERDQDFVVTEAHDQSPELVGGFGSAKEDDLGIESPADLMEAEAAREVGERHLPDPVETAPIGDTTPPPPPAADKPLPSDSVPVGDTKPDTDRTPSPIPGLQKLSEERVQEISQRMQTGAPSNDYLSAEEKQRLISSIDKAPADQVEPKPKTGFDNQPIVPPSKQARQAEPAKPTHVEPVIPQSGSDSTPVPQSIVRIGDKPKKATRVRGVAHFAREYIKITGGQQLHEGDTLTINTREYMLRPKKFSSRMIIGIVALLAAVLVFALGAWLSSDSNTGAGEIVGMVLSDDDRPFISGTEIRLPDLGRSYQSNGQGFFKTDPLDAGTYKIEFLYDGQVIATDYATVVSDQITTISMRPEPYEEPAEPIAQAAQPAPPKSSAPAAEPTPPPTKAKAKSQRAASSTSRFAKLGLEANVEGAKLTVDGSVLGAGNLTYPRLKPGLHEYIVSKDGYQSYRGSVDLKAGQTKTLNVSLTKIVAVAKPAAPPEQKPFGEGTDALGRGETVAAIASFTEAITLNPSYVKAYLGRAEAHLQNNDSRTAHDDFVRAAEISAFKKDFNGALAAYDQALALNAKSVPVFLGRGNLYLSRSEEIAAVADFDMAVRLDKRNMHAYLGLGQARYNQGYFKKSIKHFKDARSIDSKNPTPHRLLMMSYYRAGDFKQVGKSYEKFVKCASEAELQQLHSDARFAPVLQVARDRN